MDIYFTLSIATLLLIVSLITFIVFRIFAKKWYKFILITSIFLAGAISFFPLNEGVNVLPQIGASLLDSAKLFVLEANYLDTLAMVELLMPSQFLFAEVIFGILFVCAPICTVIFIISLISDAITYFGVRGGSILSKYVFSELNEKTISLAKSIKTDARKKGHYIFCNVPKYTREQNIFYQDAKNNNFVIIERSIQSIKPSFWKDTYYCVISDNSSINLDSTLKLMDEYHGKKNVKIIITSNEVEDETLLDSKNEVLKNHYGNTAYLRHINETRLMAYELLQKNPLYNAVKTGENKISMLIIGGGYVGLEILKNSIWCSRSLSYSFEATVLDRDPDLSEGRFNQFCPALNKQDYNISFYPNKINADTDQILNFVRENNNCFNYIVVSTSNDETNIRTALDLRALYLRERKSAIISIVVRDNQKLTLVKELNPQEIDDNANQNVEQKLVKLFTFGCTVPMYDYETIIDNSLEKLAICINSVYDRTTSMMENNTTVSIEKNSAESSWNSLKLLKRRSSRALALFIEYVLWSKGYSIDFSKESTTSDEIPFTDSEVEKYAILEHSRWNAYQLIEGYYPWPYNEWKDQAPIEDEKKVTQNKDQRLHACITDWETLNKMDSEFHLNFAIYDKEFIRAIPDIIDGFDGEMGYRYKIQKREKK